MNFAVNKDSQYIEENRLNWNENTPIHQQSDFYNVDEFKKGKSTLNSIELQAIGNVNGKSLLHLQCHFGMDSLSWARNGAEVTGVDISDASIKVAEGLASELNIKAKFIRSNIYDLDQNLDGDYDIVFTSYGTIIWLPDLDKWASIVAAFLKPGGTFVIVDFHPFIWTLDSKMEKFQYSYFNRGVITETESGSYADPHSGIENTSHTWNHSLSELIQSLISNGLVIQEFEEYPYSPYNITPNMIKVKEGEWQINGMEGMLPITYMIKATKP